MLIPLLFMGDVVGRLFREFAVTLSMTIVISAVVSLTLTPMMCARLLHHRREAEQGTFYRQSQRMFDRAIAAYGRTLRWVLNHQPATLVVTAATLAFTIFLMSSCPRASSPCRTPVPFWVFPKRPIDFICRDGRTSTGIDQGHPRRSRRLQPVVVHRCGRNQHDAQQWTHLY